MAFFSTLTTNLDKFKRLSRKERGLFLQAVLLLPAIHFALLLLGYSRLLGVMEKLVPVKPIETAPSDAQVLQRAQEISRIVSIAAQYGVYRATCLRKSLLVWGFLRREGMQGRVCFGVRMCARKLEAHAWVEYKGMVVNDSLKVHECYTALREVLPPTRAGL
jgi:hypothetical protein